MNDPKDEDIAAEDEQAALQVIEAMRKLRGISRRELDRRLGKSEGYMAQVLGGFVGLRFKLLTRIIRVLDFEPWVFFATVFSRPPGTILDREPTALDHILEILTTVGRAPRRGIRSAAPASLPEVLPRVQRMMEETVRRAKTKKEEDAPAGEKPPPPKGHGKR